MTFTGIIALLYSNKYLRQLRKLIESGRGTFSDTFRYTDKSADLLGDLFYGSVLDMPDEERITSCVELLRDRHKDINGLFDIAQRSLDKKAGLSIAPQHVPFDEERAKQIGTSLTDKTVPETTIQRRAKSATANATRSMHDDCIEANAKFRAKAGLQCYITRTTDGSCCKWCTQMAGRYEYGSEPKNVYRRHDNCGCMVTYENGRKRQNVWSKKTWEVPADDAGAPPPVVFTQEQAAAAGAPPPKSFTKEEAQELNDVRAKDNARFITVEERKELLSRNPVDISQKSGIIRESSKPKPITEITDKAVESVPKVDISGYTDEQCAIIQQQHKELLEYSRKHNNNKEVAFVFDSSLENRKEFMGADDKIDFGRGLYGSNITVLHNHPRNSSYSVTDIIFFGDNSNVKTLTIVKNNGKVEYLTKSEEFKPAVFKLEYDRLYRKIVKKGTDSEKDKFVKTLLNKSKSGVIWSERT